MGSDLSTPGPNQKDPPTPSTVRSFADDLPASTRSPPIGNEFSFACVCFLSKTFLLVSDDARENDVRGGRLGRFLSDAMPTTKTTSKLPIPQEIHVVKEGSNEVPTIEQDADMRHMMVRIKRGNGVLGPGRGQLKFGYLCLMGNAWWMERPRRGRRHWMLRGDPFFQPSAGFVGQM